MSTIIAARQNLRSRARSRRALRHQDEAESLSVDLVSAQSSARPAIERSIARTFQRVYGAQPSYFLPRLLRLCVAGKLGAVAGIRPAMCSDLFLEQYLEQPIQQAVARAFGTPVDRAQIVEIGNLAASIPGLGYTLFAVLATVLSRAEYRWVACTATPQVESMLSRMNFSSRRLCNADPSRLRDGVATWGDYYASAPKVIVGDVRRAADEVSGNRKLSVLIQQLRPQIDRMVTNLARTSQ